MYVPYFEPMPTLWPRPGSGSGGWPLFNIDSYGGPCPIYFAWWLVADGYPSEDAPTWFADMAEYFAAAPVPGYAKRNPSAPSATITIESIPEQSIPYSFSATATMQTTIAPGISSYRVRRRVTYTELSSGKKLEWGSNTSGPFLSLNPISYTQRSIVSSGIKDRRLSVGSAGVYDIGEAISCDDWPTISTDWPSPTLFPSWYSIDDCFFVKYVEPTFPD